MNYVNQRNEVNRVNVDNNKLKKKLVTVSSNYGQDSKQLKHHNDNYLMQKRLLFEGSPSTSRLDPLLELIVKRDLREANERFPIIKGAQQELISVQATEPFEIQPRGHIRNVSNLDYLNTVDNRAELRSKSVLDSYQTPTAHLNLDNLYSKDIGL
jgi:hypothetical protein